MIRSIVLLLSAMVALAGCTQKIEPREALERYFAEDAQLDTYGWQFYAVQEKPSGFFAYVIFPESGQRMAPVEPELRRLCPDSKQHAFWRDTGLTSFDLVLVKTVDAQRGKAKRLLQITCDAGFDLAAFEAEQTKTAPKDDTVSAPHESEARALRYPERPALPDADVASYAVEPRLEVKTSLPDMQYAYPREELEKVRNLIARFHAKQIDTRTMTAYYPGFATFMDRIPHFEKAATRPPDKPEYAKYYYQNGSIRVQTEIKDGRERVKKNVFYNERGAPVVVIERWGFNNASFFAAVIEYDQRGYLSRVTHASNGPEKIFEVSVYRVAPDYDNTRKYTFNHVDGEFRLLSRTTHTQKGSYIWHARTGTERKYTSTRFRDSLNFSGKYPSLASLVPIPE